MNKGESPGVVVHIYNPSYSEGGGRRITTQGQARKRARPYLKNKLKAKKGWRGDSSSTVLA
jgi:hypothetical protein